MRSAGYLRKSEHPTHVIGLPKEGAHKMIRLVRISYTLRGEFFTADLSYGDARLVTAALQATYPGLSIEQVEVVK